MQNREPAKQFENDLIKIENIFSVFLSAHKLRHRSFKVASAKGNDIKKLCSK